MNDKIIGMRRYGVSCRYCGKGFYRDESVHGKFPKKCPHCNDKGTLLKEMAQKFREEHRDELDRFHKELEQRSLLSQIEIEKTITQIFPKIQCYYCGKMVHLPHKCPKGITLLKGGL